MILPAVRYNMGIGFLPEEFAGDDLESGSVSFTSISKTFPDSRSFWQNGKNRTAEIEKSSGNPHDVNPDDLLYL